MAGGNVWGRLWQHGAPAAQARCGPYRLIGQIGQGASAEIWLAQRDDSPAQVALKRLRPQPGAAPADVAELRARLKREAEVLRRLAHADIVALLDEGQEHGEPWLALQRAEGVPLTRYAQPARLLPEALVLGILARIAKALAHAHARGVLHRDLKPDNVIVDLPRDRMTLLDFGVARLDDSAATRTGMTLGTPVYMAPELLAGQLPTPASDTYALGVIGYQLLSASLPFDAASMGELLREVAAGRGVDLGVRRPDLARPLRHAVQAAMAPEPQHRPADLAAWAQQLKRLAEPQHPQATS